MVIVVQFVLYAESIFFLQVRHTKSRREFKLIKFRTMREAWDINGYLLPDHNRLTKFGRFLRNTKIDELPNLLNVVRGDLSLVGPRPLPIKYAQLMSKQQLNRYNLQSGLTGLAQISGGNNLSWSEKLKMDIDYIEKCSFLTDLKIIFRTFKIIFKAQKLTDFDHKSFDDYKPNFN
jgi:sugar transferase EpsL